MIFAGKKVLVFGTGKSGIAAEELLHKKGASVVLYDGNDKLEKEEILKKLESRDSVEVVLGELPEEMLDSLDLVVLSPGTKNSSCSLPISVSRLIFSKQGSDFTIKNVLQYTDGICVHIA